MADEAYADIIAAKRDYLNWHPGRQAAYANACVRNKCSTQAAHDLRFERYKKKAIREYQMMERQQITVEEIVEAKIGFERTSAEIETLSDETRFALMLAAADVPIEHIAKLLFMTPSAVRQRLDRGRERLKEVIGR